MTRDGMNDEHTGPTMVALLVEDNLDDAEIVRVRLESEPVPRGAPIRLLHAATAASACAVLRQQEVDVVILDLSLPDAHGLEAIHRIRAEVPDVPIVVLTGTADETLALEALRAGAQDYVLKPPPDGRAVRRVLRYARERHQLMQQLDAAIQASESAARRWRVLAELAGALSAPDLTGSALSKVANILVPDVADCFVVFVPGDEEMPRLVEVAHIDQRRRRAVQRRIHDLLPAHTGASDPLVDLLGKLEQARATGPISAPESLLTALHMASGSIVPVHVAGSVRGFATLAATPERGHVDPEFVRFLADRLSLALERLRLMRQIQRAIAARDRTLGIVSHDLGNALHTIEICAKAILDPDPQPPVGIRHMAEIIQRSAAWMLQIVQDLVDRASLDAGRLALDRRPTPVADVISGARTMFSAVAAERELEFSVTCEPDLPLVDADPDRLLQILSNLLSNAMKFTPASGRVELSARMLHEGEVTDASVASGGDVKFTVSDSGPGLPAEVLSRDFDWFWESGERKSSGAGLGLAIAHGLVEAHGSRLYVESSPGSGSRFWFTLPPAPARPAAVPTE
jgi:signal transduction histidine kinase/DNA-binding NarL/FixJ family response regulator